MGFFNNKRVDGSKSPSAKLNDLERRCIVEARGHVKATSLARIFSVDESTIRHQWKLGAPKDEAK